MTCIVGIVDGDRVVIGSDSLASMDDWGRERLDKKIFSNGEYVIGVSGSYRAAQIIKYEVNFPKLVLEHQFENPNKRSNNRKSGLSGQPNQSSNVPVESSQMPSEGQINSNIAESTPDNLEAIHRFFVKKIIPLIISAFDKHGYDPDKGDDNSFGAIVGIDKYVIEIEPDYGVGVYDNYASSGSGIHYALSSFYTIEKLQDAGIAKDLNADQKVLLSLMASSEHVGSVGGTLYAMDTKDKSIYIL
jgi:hypothetical protein